MVVLSSVDGHHVLSFNPSFSCMDRECMREAVLLWIARWQCSSMCLRLCWSLAFVFVNGLGSCRFVWALGPFFISKETWSVSLDEEWFALHWDGTVWSGFRPRCGSSPMGWILSPPMGWWTSPFGFDRIDTDTAFVGDGKEERVDASPPSYRTIQPPSAPRKGGGGGGDARKKRRKQKAYIHTKQQTGDTTEPYTRQDERNETQEKEIETADASNTKPTPHVELGRIGCLAQRKPST